VISKETITLVRDRTDLVAVLSESVPSLKRRGRRFIGLCPFHKEKTPSFNVNPDTGFYYCFGCKESGDVFTFMQRHEGYTFHEAVRALAERASILIEEEDRADRADYDRQKKQREDLYAVNQLAATFYEQMLREHPQRQLALDELARRGLEPKSDDGTSTVSPRRAQIEDVLQAFRIGYAPPAWDGLATFLKAQGVSPIAAESVGLLVPRPSRAAGAGDLGSRGSGHYDFFRHRLMFAVADVQGRVVAFSGRALGPMPGEEERDDGTSATRHGRNLAPPPPKYINSRESPIYTKGTVLFGLHQARHAVRQREEAIIVEGNFDVVSLHARGIDNVVGPLGTAFTPEQAKLLKRFASNVVLLFDSDAAGKKATRAAREPCRAAGLTARVATLPEGKDPDDFVRAKGPDALCEVLSRARGMLEHLIDIELDEEFAAADAQERVTRVERVAKLLAEEEDPVVRSMAKTYADQLAGRLDLHGLAPLRDESRSPEPFRALLQKVRRALATAQATPTAATDPSRARIRRRAPGSAFRAEIVGAILEFPALLDDHKVQPALELLEGPSALTIAAARKALVERVARGRPAADTQTANLQEAGSGPADPQERRPADPQERRPADPLGAATQEKALDSTVFLAQIPQAIQAFASARLAAPQHESIDDARASLFENAKKLSELILSQETSEIAREQHKAAGDWEQEAELAREALERVRRKHGVKK
jgi:DNA primase